MVRQSEPRSEPQTSQDLTDRPAGRPAEPWQAAGLTAAEYRRVLQLLGREPGPAELGLIGVLWSEHCAYKHSRPLLRRLPTRGSQVLLGPGENAGAVDLGDGTAVVFRIESHNHPSFVEPFQGAATGVGGILRDVLAAGARPVALMDFLCFAEPRDDRDRRLVRGVVAGIAAYGNCTGVPVVGGRVLFEPGYRTNPLVNVLCAGVAPAQRLLKGVAAGPGARLVLIGPPTGADGVHGATFASASLGPGDAAGRRPAVQVGDPFAGKVLIEACLELVEAGLVAAFQDLGAGGLGAAAAELASRAGTGAALHLDRVPLREPGLPAEVILLSESQERMLAVVEPAHLPRLRWVTRRWGLPAAVVGRLEEAGDRGGRFRARHRGRWLVDLPVDLLTRQAPVYGPPGEGLPGEDRGGDGGPGGGPVAAGALAVLPGSRDRAPAGWGGSQPAETPAGPWPGWAPPQPGAGPGVTRAAAGRLDPGEAGDGRGEPPDLRDPQAVAGTLRRLLASPALASKSWIYSQFDHLVGGRTRLRPGAGPAAVLEVPGSDRLLVLAMAGTGRQAALDPFRAAALAVAEAALRASCVGGIPLGLTNGLNLGDPGRPAVYAQLAGLIDGMAAACRALDLPVTGGNVSLYNATGEHDIDPTVAVSVAGVIPPPGRWAAGFFSEPGLRVALLGPLAGRLAGSEYVKGGGAACASPDRPAGLAGHAAQARGGGDPAARSGDQVPRPGDRVALGGDQAALPQVPWELQRRLQRLLQEAVAQGWVVAARPAGRGGLLVTLVEMAFAGGPLPPGETAEGAALGLDIAIRRQPGAPAPRRDALLFGEGPARVVVAVPPGAWDALARRAAALHVPLHPLGLTGEPGGRIRVRLDGALWLDEPAASLWTLWEEALPCRLDGPESQSVAG
ncbi:AIR synthase related protein [Thermaerobacter sp. PB12/4term]|uniref:AIR synthase related protein n=1 Tax=Thermaerobacter sp. PB12/4term TaxID=2293838 RepID=UPI002738F099|nr:AIR synthase related protein [Thermaerobacter sp. PB12/4term]